MTNGRQDARLLRPVPYFVWATTIALGLSTLVTLAVAIAFFFAQQIFGLFWLALGVGSGYVLLEIRHARLSADASSIELRAPFQRSRCLRSELASMRVGPPIGRSGAPCEFVRGDDSVAFKTPVATWGAPQLISLAEYLGVPFIDPRTSTAHPDRPADIGSGGSPG